MEAQSNNSKESKTKSYKNLKSSSSSSLSKDQPYDNATVEYSNNIQQTSSPSQVDVSYTSSTYKNDNSHENKKEDTCIEQHSSCSSPKSCEDLNLKHFENDIDRLSLDLESLQMDSKRVHLQFKECAEEQEENVKKSEKNETQCLDLLQKVIQLQDLRKRITHNLLQTSKQEEELRLKLSLKLKEKEALLKEIKEVDKISKDIRLSIVQHIGNEEIESKKVRLSELVSKLRNCECDLD
jgi:hypothetical protein